MRWTLLSIPLLTGCLYIGKDAHEERIAEFGGDCATPADFFPDLDGDGFGGDAGRVSQCAAPDGFVSTGGDCDDDANDINPDAQELCDGVDNDCDGTVDAGDSVFFLDEDQDGYGLTEEQSKGCAPDSGWSAVDGDCDDANAAINPDADEVCDEVDNDCDGTVDGPNSVDAVASYLDTDGDGYGGEDSEVISCSVPNGYITTGGDCDDDAVTINPDADEVCDTIDNDCDGNTDESDAIDATRYYADSDGDGYGDDADDIFACSEVDGYVLADGDCDDGNKAVNPDAAEVCDSVDNNCDGSTDGSDSEDAPTWYRDNDGDNYGDTSATLVACDDPGSSYAGLPDDCNDNDKAIFPGATELCDGVDNSCDGQVDEGFTDTDGDSTADCVDVCPVYADASGGRGDGSESNPYGSIAEAQALRGEYCDEIVLLPDTFDEYVDFGGEDIVIRGRDGARYTVIEAPTSSGSVITANSGESDLAVLEGVTITGGRGQRGSGSGYLSSGAYHGGGIYVEGADLTIRDCIIDGNDLRNSAGYGGGVVLADWNGVFEGNTVSGNVADDGGGGIYLQEASGIVSDNLIEENDTDSAQGGGILGWGGDPSIVGNVIRKNKADVGGGVYLSSTDSLVANNVFTENDSHGLVLGTSDTSSIINNTLWNEFVAIIVGGATDLDFVNNIISESGYIAFYRSSGTVSTYEDNNVWDSGFTNFYNYTDPTGSDGNISVEPKINNPGSGDFTLQAGSGCIDSGQDASVYGVSDDIDGNARPDGGGWDMGATEQ